MAYFLLLLPALVTAVLVLLSVPVFQRFFWNIGVTGIDQQKKGKPVLPTSGGIPVAISFFFGVMLLIALNTFFFKDSSLNLQLLLAATLSSLAIAVIGFFDDLHVKRVLHKSSSDSTEFRAGLPQWSKPLLTLVAAVPLMAVKAGTSHIFLPLLGSIEFGALYALLLVPLAVVCVSNASNMLAGINGVEAGMLGVASLGVGLWSMQHGTIEGTALAFIGAAGLLAFLYYNWPPARMLPGDSLTYFAGAVFVSAAVAGNVEKFAFYAFLPWVVESFLKLRGKFAVRSYGDLQPDGSLKSPYAKVYSLTHAVMKLGERLGRSKLLSAKGFTEKQVALVLVGMEVLLVALLFAIVQV